MPQPQSSKETEPVHPKTASSDQIPTSFWEDLASNGLREALHNQFELGKPHVEKAWNVHKQSWILAALLLVEAIPSLVPGMNEADKKLIDEIKKVLPTDAASKADLLPDIPGWKQKIFDMAGKVVPLARTIPLIEQGAWHNNLHIYGELAKMDFKAARRILTPPSHVIEAMNAFRPLKVAPVPVRA